MLNSLFPSHWSTLKKLIWLKAAQGGGGGLTTLTEAIVSFIAKKAKAINSLVVNIEPQQSGTGDPSPENIRSITGVTGATVILTNGNCIPNNNAESYSHSSSGSTKYDEELDALYSSGNGYSYRGVENYLPLKDDNQTFNLTVFLKYRGSSSYYFRLMKNGDTTVNFTPPSSSTTDFSRRSADFTAKKGDQLELRIYGGFSWKDLQITIGSGYQESVVGYNRSSVSIKFPALGKNLFNPDTVTEGYAIAQNGSISESAVSCYTDIIPVTAGSYYTYSGKCVGSGSNNKRIHGYTDGIWQQQITYELIPPGDFNFTFQIPEGINGIRISAYKADTSRQVEKSASKTSYELYTNTVYSGTFDFLSGEGVAKDRCENVVVSSLYQAGDTYCTFKFFTSKGRVTSNNKQTVIGLGYKSNVLAVDYRTSNIPYTFFPEYSANNTNIWIVLPAEYDTVEKANTHLSELGAYILYPLVEPITFTLSPQQISTLVGQNNIWCDSSDSVSVTIPSNIIVT